MYFLFRLMLLMVSLWFPAAATWTQSVRDALEVAGTWAQDGLSVAVTVAREAPDSSHAR